MVFNHIIFYKAVIPTTKTETIRHEAYVELKVYIRSYYSSIGHRTKPVIFTLKNNYQAYRGLDQSESGGIRRTKRHLCAMISGAQALWL